jgi:hypothetical protein
MGNNLESVDKRLIRSGIHSKGSMKSDLIRSSFVFFVRSVVEVRKKEKKRDEQSKFGENLNCRDSTAWCVALC